MIRIGLSRWFIQAAKTPAPNGHVKISLTMVPQASRFRVLVKHWHGLRDELVERDIEVEPILVERSELRYDLERKALREATVWQLLAGELASSAVESCLRQGIVDCAGYDRAAGIWLVKTALMKNVERGQSDVPETTEYIDLAADMRAIREERERQRIERERLARNAYAAHVEELARRERERPETKLSFELLYSLISAAEKKEAEEKGRITIRNVFGEFRIPVATYGLVERYVDKVYEASYCIVFKDHSIPLGDECLMKIALLKTDPQKFLKTANRFVRRAA